MVPSNVRPPSHYVKRHPLARLRTITKRRHTCRTAAGDEGVHGVAGSLLRNRAAVSRMLIGAALIAAALTTSVHSAAADDSNDTVGISVSATAAGQIPEPVEVTVSVASIRLINTPGLLANARVRFGFNPVLGGDAVPPEPGSDDKMFSSTSWRFTNVIVPQPTTEDGTYPLRIEGLGTFPFFGSPTLPLDFDPHVCGEGGFGCAVQGVNRPEPDDLALDLTLNLNEGTWVGVGEGEAGDGDSNLEGERMKQKCVQGTAGDARAAGVCFTISWEIPRPTLTVTKDWDDNRSCDPTDCSLRAALLAAPDFGAIIVLPHDQYRLDITA